MVWCWAVPHDQGQYPYHTTSDMQKLMSADDWEKGECHWEGAIARWTTKTATSGRLFFPGEGAMSPPLSETKISHHWAIFPSLSDPSDTTLRLHVSKDECHRKHVVWLKLMPAGVSAAVNHVEMLFPMRFLAESRNVFPFPPECTRPPLSQACSGICVRAALPQLALYSFIRTTPFLSVQRRVVWLPTGFRKLKHILVACRCQ